MTVELSATTTGLPETLAAALDKKWLARALAPISGGAAVEAVEQVEVLRTMATKARFRVEFADGTSGAFCLKGFLDVDAATARAGPTMLHEADFYLKLAANLDIRLPECVVAITDRETPRALIIMRDLVADGARFCLPHDDFTREQVAADLAQFAILHGASRVLAENPWIDRRVERLAKAQYITAQELQAMLDGPRGEPLPAAIRDARRVIAGLGALAARDAERPQFLIHGDSHAGNLFRNREGKPGLIDWQLLQRGGWALDIAYHICATLPVETAAAEERSLLAEYLETMRAAGRTMPDDETAWREYREAAAYGYYLWAITRRVEPSITEKHVERLGSAVARHESFSLLRV